MLNQIKYQTIKAQTAKGEAAVKISLNRYGLYGKYVVCAAHFDIYVGSEAKATKVYNKLITSKQILPKKIIKNLERALMSEKRNTLREYFYLWHNSDKVSYYQSLGYFSKQMFDDLDLYYLTNNRQNLNND